MPPGADHCSAALADELADWLEEVELPPLLDVCTASPGVGLARVDTARGSLLHRVELAEDRVLQYLIVAPTEWNFHPRGAFVREISGCPASSRRAARFAADSLALSLDPCVAFACRFVDA
ncbi:MAG TPA: hypothetical protein DGC76_05325 [Candidatus Accumulibacter sp.]|nr:hypothetical protein [Accumulibacter sp.]